MSDFIKKKFMGEEICVWVGQDAESISYDQFMLNNVSFFKGIVVDVEHDILTLNIPEVGEIYINCNETSGNVKAIWRPGFSFHDAMETALSNKMFGSNKYRKKRGKSV